MSEELGLVGDVCIEFSYCMHGAHIDRLSLMTRVGNDPGLDTLVWSEAGDKGAGWHTYRGTLHVHQEDEQVRSTLSPVSQ